MVKKRVEWIDQLKAICMLLVIIGHFSFFPEDIAKIYSPFMLSAFLFASGYTFHIEDNFFIFILKKIKTLLFPMLWMGFFTIFSRKILSFKNQEPLVSQVIDFFIQIRGKNDELWFLACLFGSSIIFYMIIKNIKSKKIILIVTFIMSLIGIIYTNLGGPALPWHIQMYGSVCFIFSLGYIYRNKYEKATEGMINLQNFLVVFFIYIVLIICDYKVFGNFGLAFYSYGNSVIMFYSIILTSLIMIILFVKNLFLIKPLNFIGRNSLIYYGLHGKILSLLTVCFQKFGILKEGSLNNLLVSVLGLIIACLILWPISYIINRWTPFLIGRKTIYIRGDKNDSSNTNNIRMGIGRC